MLKRRSAWFGGGVSLLLVLSMSGIVAAANDLTPPDAVPTVVVDTTATFEDADANGIDDDCQTEAAVPADPAVVLAAEAAVDTNADGVISTTEAAQSARTGGKNCNHGGYVSWIAHQDDTCTTTPTEPVVTPVVAVATVADETSDENAQGAGDETKDDESEATEPDAACDATSAIDGPRKDKVAAAAARAASKAERTLVREAKKAERTAAKAAAKAERAAARLAKATAHASKAHKVHKAHKSH